ncbi:MAG: hypothetical protein QG573_1478 [Acidobacteriota bacterium]|nr:hypothetical protein [Acidobacteriota bacterium]
MPKLRIVAAIAICCALDFAAAPLAAETFLVGPTRTYTQINQVAGLLDPGDLVLVDGDSTYAPALLDRNGSEALPITLRGVRVNGNRPVLSGGVNTIEVQSNWTVVEGFEFTGGSNRCFYHHAHEVTLRDSLVRDCPAQGILGADTGSGSFTMEYVEVRACGSGTGQHGVYMATNEEDYPGAIFRMQHCWIHDQNGGNAVKSRAERNEIYYNWIENSLYHLLELIGPDPDGGVPANLEREDSDVVGNVLVRDNSFSFVRIGGDATGESAGRYRFVNNTFVSAIANGSAVFRCFDALESVEMHNNVFYSTADGGGLRLLRDLEANWVSGRQISGQNNWIESGSIDLPTAGEWTASIVGADPGFVNPATGDFRPAAGSPLLDAGTASGTPPPGFPFPNPLALPGYHPPLHSVQTGPPPPPRPTNGAIDLGAYERADPPAAIFLDGFETGDTTAWSATSP